MQTKASNLTLLICIFLFAACEEPVEIDTGFEERLAVTCHFSPDSPFNVYVSKTLDPLSNLAQEFPDYLKNANVAIYQGESLWCELPYLESEEYPTERYLNAECRASAGVEYTVKISAPGFDEVMATDIIPMKTEIQFLEMFDLEVDSESDTIASFQFNVKLILAEMTEADAYYLLNFNYERVPFQIIGNDTIVERTGEYDPLTLESLLGNPPTLNHFDEKMGGILFARRERGLLELNFRVSTPRPVLLTMDLFDQVYANLKTVSKDYYFYHLQLSRQLQQKDSLFVNPVILADNIKNGFGIFAGYQLTRDSISVDYE